MRNSVLDSMSDDDVINAVTQYGGANKAARALGIPKSTFKDRAKVLMDARFSSEKIQPAVKILPPARKALRFICSSAQNNTKVHAGFLKNIEAYAKKIDAEILISGYTYGTRLTAKDFHPSIQKYLTNRQFNIHNKLLFCGEMNIIPTAVDPLSGFETYTRSKWGIFPHPRISLKSIPTMFNSPVKQIMTTGSVTLPNYIPRKAGIKAEFHHVIGAVIVEIDADGDIFCRHLVAEKDGSFQDLTTYVEDGQVCENWHVEAITWGDIHTDRLDHETATAAWGIDADDLERTNEASTIVDDLKPSFQFFHDVLDFRRRNHHNIWDPHFRFESHLSRKDNVEQEIYGVAKFLASASRDWCKSVVVDSNHDRALTRWLKTADYRNDPENALFFLKAQLAQYEAIACDDEDFLLVEWAVKNADIPMDDVTFLKKTDSFVICPNAGGGIECGLHGDLGANGAKGNVASFAKMGPKANTADKHSAQIFEGIYQAGHSCKSDMVYNRGGLSSWSPSHIVTYPSGKRTILTTQGTKYRAR